MKENIFKQKRIFKRTRRKRMNGVQRVKSGIKGLDKVLQGGFPKGSTSLIVGPPGSGKSTLVREITYYHLSKGNKAVFITTTEPVSNIIKQMKLNNWDITSYKENISFIDAYSWRVPREMREEQELQLSSIINLNELDQLVIKAIQKLKLSKEQVSIFVFDSVSDLLLHSEPQSVFKLMQLITAKVKAVEGTAFIVLEEGLHDQRDVATLSYLTDGTINMKLELDKRFLRITRMADTVHPLTWIPFEIGRGLELKVEGFFR